MQGTSVLSIAPAGTVTVIRNPALSEEDRLHLESELAAKIATQRRDLTARRGRAALNDPRVLDIMELMKIEEPTPTEIGHIVDLVRDACDGKLNAFVDDPELTRFRRSINHPMIMGLNARHAVSAVEPPPRPMSMGEARSFAHRVGAAWLAQFDSM